MKYILLIASAIAGVLSLRRWFSCWLFTENFYYTQGKLLARVIEAINADQGMPGLATKIMHNKVTYFGWGIMQTILQFWDIRFLKEFIGISCGIGVYLAVWYLVTKDTKNKYIWFLFGVAIVLSIIELFFAPHIVYFWKIVSFGGIFITLSLYGINSFLNKGTHLRYTIILIAVIISYLSLIFLPESFLEFCLKI